MKLQEKIEVLQAAQRGEPIQYRNLPGREPFRVWFLDIPEWTDTPLSTTRFNFGGYEYRVKPKEPREFWVNVYEKGFPKLFLHETPGGAAWEKGLHGKTIRVREVL